MKLGDGVSVIKNGEKSFNIVGVKPTLKEKVIVKRRYDAFIDTDLNEYLSTKNIKTIILTGAYGSRCILATAFVGSSLGYNVFLAKDLIGNPAAFEFELKTAINIVTRILGYVYESEDIVKYWQSHKQ
jgi:nicotinamidase-related amidase